MKLIFSSKALPQTFAWAIASAIPQGLQQIMRHQTTSIGEINLFSQMQEELVKSWQGSEPPQTLSCFLFDFLSRQAVEQPGAVAIDAWDGQWTYQELDEISTTLASHLQTCGVQSGTLVIACFEKTSWAVVALLAVNKAGGGFVPCDPTYPAERREKILQQAGSPLIITSAECAGLFAGLKNPSVMIISPTTFLNLERASYRRPTNGEAPAYVLFTSGSTGEPKGCEISHKAFASISNHVKALHLGPASRVLQFASFSFGMAIIEIFCTLAAGGTVCMLSDEQRLNSLAATMTKMKINWALTTPTVLGSLQPHDLPYLKCLVVAGEGLNEAQIQIWSAALDIFQAYGLTEWTGIFAVSHRITSIQQRRMIGVPVNGQAWLIDPSDHHKLVPVGAAGELVIRGPGLAAGYYRATERTKASFFSPKWLTRWTYHGESMVYRTGDIMRYNADGSLSYVRRGDNQVKIRGMRVELNEVEYNLMQLMPEARRVVAMLWKPQERDGQQVLLALIHMPPSDSKPAVLNSTDGELLFLQPTTERRRTIDNALEALHSRLPEYMIPQYLLALAAFPTTVTGKVDRQKLVSLTNGMTTDDLQRLAGRQAEHQAPTTESERQVYDLTCTILGVKSVSMNDNFFDLAGDSVAAMKMAGLARRRKIQLTVADVFNRPVLKDLASAVRQLNNSTTSQRAPFGLLDAAVRQKVIHEAANHMDAAQIADIYPCTPLQEGIWALSMRNPTLYKARVICHLRPDVDLDRFRTAWERVFGLNDILRTRLFPSHSGVFQAALRESFEWDAAEELQSYLDRVDREHMGVGSRLVRACLLANDNQATFVLTIHHALCDRWSLRLLLEQIEKQLSPVPPSTNYSFSPFIEHLVNIAPQLEKFWVDQFQGLEASPFPALPSPDYTPTAHQISRFNLCLPRRVLREKTLASHLRLAWSLVISHNTCSDDIVFGSTVTGRGSNVNGIEALSGPTIATVPFRTSLNPDGTIARALAAVQEQSISMIPFEQAGLQKIQRCSPEAESACMFQSTLTVQPAWPDSLTLFKDCQEGAATAGGFASYALCIECYPNTEETQMEIQVAYDANVLPPTRMGRLIDHFEFVLHEIMKGPNKTIREIQHISPSDLIQLGRWNETIPFQPQQTVHSIVQSQAKKTPHAPAISSLDGELTYQELDRYSTQLAGELLLLGARPGMLIPVLFEKSRWAIVAMMAVLKAGGGIVALDPSYPVDRMRAICGQVESPLGICSERYAATLQQIGPKPIIASESSGAWRRPVEDLNLPVVGADSTMYLIFTSGSTGMPKGVVVNHDCFASSTLAYRAEINLDSYSRLLQFCSFAFDVCFAEIFGTLMAGACLCIPSDADRMNDIHHPMRALRVTHAFFTPSYARLVQPEQVPSLRVVMLAGEPVKASDVEHWAPHVHLVNGYGPSECAPISATQCLDGSVNVQSQDIGYPRGCVAWICDPRNHDTLLPIGAIGELVIEGPNVGPGYFQNASDTMKAFMEAPRWLQGFRGHTSKRVYKTKDLVHYTEDGRLRYVGRIGQQVKLRGQRLEPSHVEHHLLQSFDGAAEVAAIVATPKDADGRATLVGFVLSENAKARPGGDICLPPSEEFCLLTATARSKLQQSLPEFMVPSLIISVSSMPRTPSGKLDRQRLTREITSRTWDQLMEFEALAMPSHVSASDTEKELQTIWSRVLNLPVSAIGTNKSFFQLGGDSITAMLVVAQARAGRSRLQLTVEDIFRLRTISQIVTHATNSSDRLMLANHDTLDTPFDLSPIQQLFFDTNRLQQQNRFNHNLLLHLKKPVSFDQLRLAMQEIAEEHPLLRARFLLNADGQWKQLIPSEIEGSYGCRHHQLTSADMVKKVLMESRRALDISAGPVFSADLIDIDGNQSIFLLAHHLVIDMVSWTVLLADLETLLHGRSIPTGQSTSFQTWCTLLAAYGHESLSVPQGPLHYSTPEDFWGTSECLNTIGGTHETVIQIDTPTTEALLGEANNAFGTQPVELLHAALLFAFTTTFSDRPAPVIFSEGHGREPWDSAIDLTRTVGWFTTIAPVHVEVDAAHDIATVVRQVKDTRRRLCRNGLEAFTANYFNTRNQKASPAGKMEIVFNYAGRYHQQLGQAGSLFEVESLQNMSIFDAADDARRWSMVDINAFVQDGQLAFTFTYPQGCNPSQVLQPWTASLRKALNLIASEFKTHPRSYTLADFPMLDLDYSQLDCLLETLQHANIRPEDVEEIYPCSPMQRGILLSQAKDPSCYQVVITWEIVPGEKRPASAERAKAAIEQVMARHASLRTCFIETTSEVAAFDQVVLCKPHHQIVIYNSGEKDAQALLQSGQFQASPHSPLRFLIFVSCDQKVYIRLDISHALTDAKSIDLLKRDICLAYDNQLSSPVGPLFSNYISFIQTRDPIADAEFWDTYLDGIQPCQFPALTKQANTESGVTNDYVFDVAGVDGIELYCRNRNVTAPNVFGLAWALVLGSYTGSYDVCFGNLNSGREMPFDGAPEVVGPLINMLTMRVKFKNATIEQLVQQVHADYAAGLAHQTYPVADIFHRKGLSGRSLFNTGISVERVDGPQHAKFSTDLRLVHRVDPTEYDIVLNVEIEKSRTIVHLRYWSSCLSDSQAPLIAACFDQAVTMIINDDQAPASSLNLFCQAHHNLIWHWNKELSSYHDCRVHDVVQKRATECPDAPAVCSSGRTLTYRELDVHSTALAHYLSQHGVGTEMFVPLCFEKGMWTAVAILAVLKTGAAFVLLDSGHPDQRIETICQDVGGPLLLSSPAQAERCALFSSTVVVVGGTQDLWRCLLPAPSSQLFSAAMQTGPTNAAYAVYTSGSTGKPKGIIIEHGSFCSMVHAQAPILNMNASARVLQFSSYAFDVSIFEMLMPLMTGGCVCVLSEVERRDRFVETMGTLRISHALLTPSFSRLVSPAALPDLRVLVCGGEAMTHHDMERWLDHVILINHYGPAECSVCSVVQPNINTTSRVGEIGWGVGCATWVVDPDDHERLVPIGVVGELVIEGPIVGRGYLNNPTATQTAFIEPPRWLRNMRSSLGRNNRLYKTGDLVRYGSDGRLYIHGRKDTQIKVRGQRLELQELEYHIHRCFESAGNVVVELVRNGSDGSPRLFAFIASTKEVSSQFDGFSAVGKEFRDRAAAASTKLFESLPSYMVPTYFVPSVTLPLNSSGKVDRKQLQSWASALSSDQLKDYRPSAGGQCKPSSPEEKLLHAIWVDVLRIKPETIGAEDHFFQVGGDSVTAMRVAASARKQGLNIVVADIFAHPRLAALAKAGTNSNIEQFVLKPFSLCPVTDRELFSMLLRVRRTIPSDCHIVDILPTSATQSFFMTTPTLHHFTFDIDGPLDIRRLRDACDKVFNMFAILRTVFVPYAKQILQVILDKVNTPFHHFVVDEPIPDVRRRLQTADREHIPLKGPLVFAFVLISHSDGSRHSLSFRVSHAQWDGLSIAELFSSVQEAYHARPLTPSTPLSTYIYYRALRDKTPSLQFWKDYLQGSKITRITEPPSAFADLTQGDTIWENTNLQPAPEPPLGITMASVVRSAWSLVLGLETGARDIVFGQTVNSRSCPLPDIDRILGCCLNFIPARIQLQQSWTGRDLLQHAQTQYQKTVKHDDIELQEIIDHCTAWPNGTDFNTIVQHQNIPLNHTMLLGDLQTTFSPNGYFRPGRELFIFTEPFGDLLSVQLCVNPNVMDLPRARSLHHRLVKLIVDLCCSPDEPISCFLE
ncbi:nonribosomal peptide synthase [Aspergillus udagawae]|uniref:Nonribosomal peptide synthase n=1 Tax=Aspergillus udagawae TaxID=91492 RepID=A0A8E0QW03_9EURO|nr:nonribosomal peptide synthase [Aspergillus udagawae]GIC91342.1 nonribosomal peptide synthase [Aspergillus udagawae]